jgi:hypothetical protein
MQHAQPRSSIFKRPQLPEDLIVRIKWIHAVLGDAQELPLGAFIDIFDPTDRDVDQAVTKWQSMAMAHLMYTKRRGSLSAAEKQAAFLLLLCRVSGKPMPPELQHSPAVVLWEELGDLYDAFASP